MIAIEENDMTPCTDKAYKDIVQVLQGGGYASGLFA